jgi:D-sedoheptulose 7-phosphate isomerase
MKVMPGFVRVTRAVEQHFSQVSVALSQIPSESVEEIVQAIVLAHAGGRHIYILGNGGSASTATHFACDLSKATLVAGRSRLKVTSLGDNVALLTAWANDTSYDRVFAEPLMNLLEPDDIVIAISASGNSANVVEAIKVASQLGALTIGLVGFDGGRLKGMVDIQVQVRSHDYGVVEDCHLVLQHAITESVKATLLA